MGIEPRFGAPASGPYSRAACHRQRCGWSCERPESRRRKAAIHRTIRDSAIRAKRGLLIYRQKEFRGELKLNSVQRIDFGYKRGKPFPLSVTLKNGQKIRSGIRPARLRDRQGHDRYRFCHGQSPRAPFTSGALWFKGAESQKKPDDPLSRVSALELLLGGMAEWFKAAVLKTVVPGRVPGVRIPLPPFTISALKRTLTILTCS